MEGIETGMETSDMNVEEVDAPGSFIHFVQCTGGNTGIKKPVECTTGSTSCILPKYLQNISYLTAEWQAIQPISSHTAHITKELHVHELHVHELHVHT